MTPGTRRRGTQVDRTTRVRFSRSSASSTAMRSHRPGRPSCRAGTSRSSNPPAIVAAATTSATRPTSTLRHPNYESSASAPNCSSNPPDSAIRRSGHCRDSDWLSAHRICPAPGRHHAATIGGDWLPARVSRGDSCGNVNAMSPQRSTPPKQARCTRKIACKIARRNATTTGHPGLAGNVWRRSTGSFSSLRHRGFS